MITIQELYASVKRNKCRWMITMALLLVSLILICTLTLLLGNTYYSPITIFRVLSGEQIQGATFAILTIRLPRMLAGLLVGLAFGMAGHVFQVMLRNPLASPDVIGITAGSSTAAVFCIVILGLSGSAASFLAVGFGMAVAIGIYLLSGKGRFLKGRLILIGIGIQAILQAIVSYLLLRASKNDVSSAMRWMSGSLNGVQMIDIVYLFFIVIVFGGILLLLERHVKLLELGEEAAITLGVNVTKVRFLVVVSAVFLISFATAVSGPIACVSFVAGPIAVKLVKNGMPATLASGFVGALLVLIADSIGQFLFAVRFPVGVITGIIGAPYLLYLLIKMNSKGGSV